MTGIQEDERKSSARNSVVSGDSRMFMNHPTVI